MDLKKLGVKEYGYVLHRAPELDAGSPFSELADLYACGVTLYRLVNGDEIIQRTSLVDVPALAAAGRFPDRAAYRDFVPRSLKIIINRAMNADPGKRFQTAQEMRRALEGCAIALNWDVQNLPNGKRWSSGKKNRCLEVQLLRQRNATWSVVTRQGPSKHSLRKITRLCGDQLSKKDAERMVRGILQDYVTQGSA